MGSLNNSEVLVDGGITALAEAEVKDDKGAEVAPWFEVRNSVFSVLGMNSGTPVIASDEAALGRSNIKKADEIMKEIEHDNLMMTDADYRVEYIDNQERNRGIAQGLYKINTGGSF